MKNLETVNHTEVQIKNLSTKHSSVLDISEADCIEQATTIFILKIFYYERF